MSCATPTLALLLLHNHEGYSLVRLTRVLRVHGMCGMWGKLPRVKYSHKSNPTQIVEPLPKSKSKTTNDISNNITTQKWEQYFKGLNSETSPVLPRAKPNNHNLTSNMKGNNTISPDDSSSTNQMYVNELVISEMSLPEIENSISRLKCVNQLAKTKSQMRY